MGKEHILPGMFWGLSPEAQMGLGEVNEKGDGIPGHVRTMSLSEMCMELKMFLTLPQHSIWLTAGCVLFPSLGDFEDSLLS